MWPPRLKNGAPPTASARAPFFRAGEVSTIAGVGADRGGWGRRRWHSILRPTMEVCSGGARLTLGTLRSMSKRLTATLRALHQQLTLRFITERLTQRSITERDQPEPARPPAPDLHSFRASGRGQVRWPNGAARMSPSSTCDATWRRGAF